MKKTLLLLGLFILAITTTITSCNEPKPENDNLNGNETNVIILGDDVYDITSAKYFTDAAENETDIYFNCNNLVFSIELDGVTEFPIGTFELVREGRYTAEVDILSQDKDYDITGVLAVSEVEGTATVTVSGEAYKDRAPINFSLTYQGALPNRK